MPTRKKYAVWLSLPALRDAVEAMSEYVSSLHERARRRERGDVSDRATTRQHADRMASSAKEVHDALDGLRRTQRGDDDNANT